MVVKARELFIQNVTQNMEYCHTLSVTLRCARDSHASDDAEKAIGYVTVFKQRLIAEGAKMISYKLSNNHL